MSVNELIEKTAFAIIAQLKKADLIKDNRLDSFKKTEKVLYELPEWKQSEDEATQKFVKLIEKALERIQDDPYYDLIELKYFKGWTHEKIAEYFGVDVSVISKRRTKLVNQLRPVIFSRDFIRELLFDL